MKVGVKEFKQAYKKVNIDKIEVTERDVCKSFAALSHVCESLLSDYFSAAL